MRTYQISISDFKYEKRFAKLAENFDAELLDDCGEYSTQLSNSYGSGVMRGINFEHGLNMMTFSLQPRFNIEMNFQLGRRHPILFLFSKVGKVQLSDHSFEPNQIVSDNEAMIFAPKSDSSYSIYLEGGQNYEFVFAGLIRFLFLSKIECDLDTIPIPLQKMFKDTIGADTFYYKNSSGPKAISLLETIFSESPVGLERKMLMQSSALKLVTTMIKSFRVENRELEGKIYFTKKDIVAINRGKKHILDNLDQTPGVKEIAQLTGMNPNKIQKGFHLLFDKSLRQFIISAKMHKAMVLLDEGEYTISEVSYALNYSNKGHFSQLFKKEFGLLPSVYLARMRSD